MHETATAVRPRIFLDMPTAAQLSGLSLRQFMRHIHEDGVPIVQIGRKFFILSRDFEKWERERKVVA